MQNRTKIIIGGGILLLLWWLRSKKAIPGNGGVPTRLPGPGVAPSGSPSGVDTTKFMTTTPSPAVSLPTSYQEPMDYTKYMTPSSGIAPPTYYPTDVVAQAPRVQKPQPSLPPPLPPPPVDTVIPQYPGVVGPIDVRSYQYPVVDTGPVGAGVAPAPSIYATPYIAAPSDIANAFAQQTSPETDIPYKTSVIGGGKLISQPIQKNALDGYWWRPRR